MLKPVITSCRKRNAHYFNTLIYTIIEFRNLELNKEGFVLMHESYNEKVVLGAL